ncbi:glycosyltransferase family 4 protein [candidate division WOR-3 bacterium]|nr:glycosyltransferase family 4 protein [candidate division WOR-3 bacterium]
MKICIVSHNFPPTICGVGDYSYWLANELENLGNNVSVITSKIGSSGYRVIESSNQVKIFPIIEKWDVFHIFKIIGILKCIKPNIIIIQYVSQLYGRAGIAPGIIFFLTLIKLFNVSHIQIITTLHELYLPWGSKDFILGAIQRLQAFILVLISDAAIVTTKSRKKILNSLFPWKRVYKISVGSNIPMGSRKREVRSRNHKDDRLILGTFGTLHPERDLLTVLKSLSMIQVGAYCYTPLLQIIGEIDKDSENYRILRITAKKLGIEERIRWMSNISNQEIANCLANSDIYLSPELDGASGRRTTLMAALSLGLPIIAYNGRETESVFKNYENIILIPPHNSKILTEKIMELIKNKKLRDSLGKKAKETFNTYFSWDIIGKEYEKIFKTIYHTTN